MVITTKQLKKEIIMYFSPGFLLKIVQPLTE